ncbi:hypothetical protein ACQP00_38275 [Dactylosporangium sp. CS-047395]|uniref:hypothetical protein n=1 Tax=Dactylosporangium sp. CS-047395 TaxID=3239936 RepID=UPI003D8E85B8
MADRRRKKSDRRDGTGNARGLDLHINAWTAAVLIVALVLVAAVILVPSPEPLARLLRLFEGLRSW